MPSPSHRTSGFLFDWQRIRGREDWSGILIGNGASRAVWDGFDYSSLFHEATSDQIANPLSRSDIRLFRTFDTENFELILSTLATAHTVALALRLRRQSIGQHYRSIQRALGQAVNAVHIQWHQLSSDTLETIGEALREFALVFSTNYDLLLYWSIMSFGVGHFRDFFFSQDCYFDLRNTDVPTNVTQILYLHGGIHLRRSISGATRKARNEDYQHLLQQFRIPLRQRESALIVTEGTSNAKLATIRRSDYLSFAYEKLRRCSRPLVVFGHSLGDSDNHLARAIARHGERPLAISITPGPRDEIVSKKARYWQQFHPSDIYFFNATTHPLGSPALKVNAQG